MFNCVKFLQDYNIQNYTSGKNSAPGWIQICCPMPRCKDTSNHGGFNIKSGYYNCWLCGPHHPIEVIKHLLNKTDPEASFIYKQYQTKINYSIEEVIKHAEKLVYPIGTDKMQKMHYDYLKNRNFDSIYLEKQYKLKGTNHIGDYKFRIICPIYFNGRAVSYQGRDITERSGMRYMACNKENEVIHHKHTLYNYDNARKNSVIVVEGVTDVWRLGDNTVALFGKKYILEQVYLLAQKYRRAFIMFDIDAQTQAVMLGAELSGLGIEAHVIELAVSDPAELTDEEAQYIKKQLIGE